MSKAAMFKGLAAAAGTIGHGMLQQQAFEKQQALDTAKARREASLMQLERDWAQQDAATAREHDFDTMEFESVLEQEAAMRERENPSPKTQAEIARIEAQTRASDATVKQREALAAKYRAEINQIGKKHGSEAADLFGKIPFDAYTPASTQKFIDNFNETGEFQVDMLKQKAGAGMGEDYRLHAFKNSLTAADKIFEHKRIPGAPTVENMIENDPALATQLEITADTPITQARARVANAFMEQTLNSVGQQQPGGLLGNPAPQPAPGADLSKLPTELQPHARAARKLLIDGADPMQIRRRLESKGVPPDQIAIIMAGSQ